MSHRTRRAHPVAVISGLALVLGLVVAGTAFGHRQPSAPAGHDQLAHFASPPCGVPAAPTTVDAAEQAAGYRVWLPASDQTDIGAVRQVWSCAGGRMVVAYQSGVRVYLDRYDGVDAASTWREAADQSSDSSVATVAGQPALLIDPGKDSAGEANGSVSLVEGGTLVVVEGNGRMPLDRLVAIAGSLRPLG
jgi:hypothetical protein